MSQPSYLSEPHVQFLSRALEEMRTGLLRIPRFQRRPLVWNVDQRLELLRSIRQGIPIGSILIWRTSQKLASLDCLGPHRLGLTPESLPQQYVLDGLQRLSALFAALVPMETVSDKADPRARLEEDWQYETYFDLEQGDFVMRPYTEEPERSQLPLTSFLDNVRYRKALRRFPDDVADGWIEVADRVSSAFQEYKIAIVPVVGDDLDLATRTFQLVNSQGTPMSYEYMVHARTWSPSFNLQEQMDRVRMERLEPIGWKDVTDDRVLDACKLCLDLKLYETEAEALSKHLRQDTSILDRTVDAMVRAAEFLGTRCGVGGPKPLPFLHHLSLLTMAFYRNPSPPSETLDLLESWFWLSTAGTTLLGISGFRMQRVSMDITKILDGASCSWPGGSGFRRKALPAGADFRSVRTKCIALLLALRSGDSAVRALGREGPEALMPVLPRATTKLSAASYSRLGNRVVCEPAEWSTLERELREHLGQALPPELMHKYVLSTATWAKLPDDPDGFVSARHADLEEMELRHLEVMAARFGFAREVLGS